MKKAHDPLLIPEAKKAIEKILNSATVDIVESVDYLTVDRAWRSWLGQSTFNDIAGLEQFKYSCFSPGTTASFGDFISRWPGRRVRVSRSDFILTSVLSRAYNRLLKPLEEGKIEHNDCVIISFPYSGNGSYYSGWEELLDQAEALRVPVFVDGAYFSISHGIKYPLDRICVTDFVTSITKSISGTSFRLGIRFTRENVDDSLSASLYGSNLFDRLNGYLSIKLLEQFPHDWIINKYLQRSQEIATKHNLTPTNTITLMLGGQEYKEFKRGDFNRVCISEELSKLS